MSLSSRWPGYLILNQATRVRLSAGTLGTVYYLGVAKSGIASALGAEERWFESSHLDHARMA
jgi:hypothetical protein